MESLGIRCLVEIEIASEHLVGTLARKHHLDTHASDDSRQEIHRGRSTHGGYIVGLDEIDDITDGIQSLLDGVVDFVVHGSDVLSNQSCFCQVRRTLQTNGEGMKSRPVSLGFATVLHTGRRILLGYGRDDGRIETTAQQYTVRNITHQLALYRSLQGIVNLLYRSLFLRFRILQLGFSLLSIINLIFLLHGSVFKPITGIVTLHARVLAVIIMTWEEWLVMVALTFQCLQLACYQHFSILIITNIKRNHADRVAGNEELITLSIVKGEGKDTVQLFKHLGDTGVERILTFIYKGIKVGICSHLTIERKNHLAVGTGLILVFAGKTGTDILMIINLTVYSKHLFLIWCKQRLATTFRVNNAQTLMCQDCRTTTVDSAPVWSAMANLLTHTKRLLSQFRSLLLNIEDRYDSTHNIFSFLLRLFLSLFT